MSIEPWTPKIYNCPDIKVSHKGYIFKNNWYAGPENEPGNINDDPDINPWRLIDEVISGTPTPVAHVITYLLVERGGIDQPHIYANSTHIVVSFVLFNVDVKGTFEPTSLARVEAALPAIIQACKASNTKCMVALGGATDNEFNFQMKAVGEGDKALLARAVTSITEFVHKHNLDGIDLDMEAWWPSPGYYEEDQGERPAGKAHPAGVGLGLLAAELRKTLGNHKIISTALPATSSYGNCYDGIELSKHLDWLGIMMYDLTGSWNLSPVGPHSHLLRIATQEQYLSEQQIPWDIGRDPIVSAQESRWYWSSPVYLNHLGRGQQVPINKLVLGVPAYGYDFSYEQGPQLTGYKTLTYKQITEDFPFPHIYGNVKVSGSVPRPWFVPTAGNYHFAHNIYFDTPDEAAAKMDHFRKVGSQGVLVWEATADVAGDASILKALYSHSGNSPKSVFQVPHELSAHKGTGAKGPVHNRKTRHPRR